jgi:hypothetical protein
MRGEESSYIVIVNGERARQAPSQQIIISALTGPSPKNRPILSPPQGKLPTSLNNLSQPAKKLLLRRRFHAENILLRVKI